MALDRLLPVSTTPGAVTGDNYMDAVQEEVTGLWDRSVITLTGVAGTNTITASAAPALTAGFITGMMFLLKPAATNTGAVTLNINGSGAVNVLDANQVALAAGGLRINAHYLLMYDSASTAFKVINYNPQQFSAPGYVYIVSQAASSSSSIDFYNPDPTFFDTYDAFELVLSSLKPATDDVELWIRIGTGVGPTYQTTNYDYAYTGLRANGTAISTSNTAQAKIIAGCSTVASAAVGNASGEHISARIQFYNPEASDFPSTYFYVNYIGADGVLTQTSGAGRYSVAGGLSAVRVMFESGNIASGRATLYGLTKTWPS